MTLNDLYRLLSFKFPILHTVKTRWLYITFEECDVFVIWQDITKFWVILGWKYYFVYYYENRPGILFNHGASLVLSDFTHAPLVI